MVVDREVSDSRYILREESTEFIDRLDIMGNKCSDQEQSQGF